jgi:hypothetical protein
LRRLFCATLIVCAAGLRGRAEQIAVRHVEGAVHGFLVVHNQQGALVAVGDISQTVRGGRVTSRLDFRFKDGSVEDETTVFTERGTFRLVSDHQVQKGPFFPRPTNVLIDVPSGQVTVRTTDKDGKLVIDSEHMDLPPDLANGLTFIIAKNLLPETPETDVPMLVAGPKLRMVKLAFKPIGEEPFWLGGFREKALRFDMKIDLGGVAGVVAPLIGKQPPDFQMWFMEGVVPAFVKETGFLYEGGPVLTFELASPVWPRNADAQTSK